MDVLHDALGRPLRSLRVSVTDRCNLRCAYCMPEEEYVWLPRADILTFEELSRLVDLFASLGVDDVHITGGEPLLRQDLDQLIRLLAAKPALRDIALTTNGVLLAQQASALLAAGLHRITISLDTLRPERFRTLTRRDDLPRVLAGIAAAQRAGLRNIKLNTVVLRGSNDDELADLVDFARQQGVEVRFIEYMDVGGATQWSRQAVVSAAEIVAAVSARFGPVRPVEEPRGSTPAARFELADGTRFGVIASTTQPFCADCDRARLTADGTFFTCLYARHGVNLRESLRRDPADAVRTLIDHTWRRRKDRGAEERLRLAAARQALALAPELRNDPHLEMHTRGG